MTKSPPTLQVQAQNKTRASLKVLQAALRDAAKNPGKEKSIHDLRVAIRRFKQTLRVYAAYFDRTPKMRRALSGLMDLCGEARNCDIALDVLKAAGVPARRDFKHELKKRRGDATKDLSNELNHWHIRSHVHRWRHWLTAKASEDPVSKPSAPELSREFLKMGAGAAAAEAPYRQMHKFRLQVKKTRYTSEILGAPQAQIEELRALQDHLGAINDCVTMADLIGEMKIDAAERRRMRTAVNRLVAKRSAAFRTYWRSHFGAKGTLRRTR